jgi:Ni/Fe-hydrogenase 1 B-type cytochrome subunit
MSAAARSGGGGATRGEVGYRWVYLWHWPIRAMHWLAAISVAVLVVTGFYIGRPYFAPAPGETADLYVMGTMRFAHFAAAGVLVATGIVRVYWLFAGNRYERFQALFPISRRGFRDLGRVLRKYILVHSERAPHYLGHNPLQQLTYTAFYGVIVVQVATGFALYGLSNPDGIFYQTFGWETLFLGGVPVVRFIHHVLTWVILVYIPIHVYMALRADFVDRAGEISSIISGGRWVRDDVHYEDA